MTRLSRRIRQGKRRQIVAAAAVVAEEDEVAGDEAEEEEEVEDVASEVIRTYFAWCEAPTSM